MSDRELLAIMAAILYARPSDDYYVADSTAFRRARAEAVLGVLVAVIAACLVTATVAVAAGDTEDLGRVIDIDEWRAQRRG